MTRCTGDTGWTNDTPWGTGGRNKSRWVNKKYDVGSFIAFELVRRKEGYYEISDGPTRATE